MTEIREEILGMNQGDNLAEIHAWIDEIPFSRPKKNIPRDFSDGVLMAEVLKFYYPRYVDAHNYISASNVAAKRDNWSTLNRKVFSKIDLKLSKDVINQLANSQQGVIEKVLTDLRNKVRTNNEPKDSSPLSEVTKTDSIDNADQTAIEKDVVNSNVEPSQVLDKANETSSSDIDGVKLESKNLVSRACGWLAGWIWPFNSVSKKLIEENRHEEVIGALEESKNEDSNDVVDPGVDFEDEVELISRLDLLRLKQEVREKNAAINTLHHRVSCLESAMKLKDQKIGNLTAQISAPESAQNLRPRVIGSSISRLRSQTKKVNL